MAVAHGPRRATPKRMKMAALSPSDVGVSWCQEPDMAVGRGSLGAHQTVGSFKIRVGNRTLTHTFCAEGYPCVKQWKA